MLVDHVLIPDPDEPLVTVFHQIWTCWNDGSFVPRVLPVPTNAIPGTREKIAILKTRLETGLILHHPEDRLSVR